MAREDKPKQQVSVVQVSVTSLIYPMTAHKRKSNKAKVPCKGEQKKRVA